MSEAPKRHRAEDLPWRWDQRSGDPQMMMLMTNGGGTLVVLAPGFDRRNPRKSYPIQTRDPVTGILRPIVADDVVASIIAEAPEMLRLLRRAHAYLTSLRDDGILDDQLDLLADIESSLNRHRVGGVRS